MFVHITLQVAMKQQLLIIFSILLITACSKPKLDQQEALRLIRNSRHYPNIIGYQINTADPNLSAKIEGTQLEQSGLIVLDEAQSLGEMGKTLIYFTEKASPYLLPSSGKDTDAVFQRVKIAEEEPEKITDIKFLDNGRKAIATYQTTFTDVTPFASLVHPQFRKNNSHTASFSLGDNGWHLDNAVTDR